VLPADGLASDGLASTHLPAGARDAGSSAAAANSPRRDFCRSDAIPSSYVLVLNVIAPPDALRTKERAAASAKRRARCWLSPPTLDLSQLDPFGVPDAL